MHRSAPEGAQTGGEAVRAPPNARRLGVAAGEPRWRAMDQSPPRRKTPPRGPAGSMLDILSSQYGTLNASEGAKEHQ